MVEAVVRSGRSSTRAGKPRRSCVSVCPRALRGSFARPRPACGLPGAYAPARLRRPRHGAAVSRLPRRTPAGREPALRVDAGACGCGRAGGAHRPARARPSRRLAGLCRRRFRAVRRVARWARRRHRLARRCTGGSRRLVRSAVDAARRPDHWNCSPGRRRALVRPALRSNSFSRQRGPAGNSCRRRVGARDPAYRRRDGRSSWRRRDGRGARRRRRRVGHHDREVRSGRVGSIAIRA